MTTTDTAGRERRAAARMIDCDRLRETITSYLTPGKWPYRILTPQDRDDIVNGIMANLNPADAASAAAGSRLSREELTQILTAVAHAPYESRKDAETIIMRAITAAESAEASGEGR